MHKAMFFSKPGKVGKNVKCRLCQRGCVIAKGATGFCRVRKNVNGILYSLNYGKLIAMHIDPIEKKPLYHFHPGTQTLSVAAVGCSFACKFCQNSEIALEFTDVFGENVEPEQLAAISLREKDSAGISWTYTEPTVFYEYFYDTMKIIRKKRPELYSVWVTNGYTTPEAIRKSRGLVDAVNIDYKGPDKLYKQLCSANLDKVHETMKAWKKAKVHMELTNLVIPGWNDSKDYIIEMCAWIKQNLGNVPLHLSRYHPYYKMLESSSPATPLETLEKAHKIAGEYLDYVYIGNVQTDKNNTYCPKCSTLLIEREGMCVSKIKLDKNKCPKCGKKIPVVL